MTPEQHSEEKLIGIREVVRLTRGIISRTTLQRYGATGRLRTVQPGGKHGRRLYVEAEVRALIEIPKTPKS